MDKLLIGLFGLTGCAGDQLVLLNCEDELLLIDEKVIWKSFTMASSAEEEGRIGIALVEGSVCSPEDAELLKKIRARCDYLVALGTCACYGGLPAMDGDYGIDTLREIVYGPEGIERIEAMRARPISDFVKVDFKLSGCPVEKDQLLETIACLLKKEFPEFPEVPVCAECRMKENVCLIIENGEVCCGPLTRSGCGARCPSLGVACIGCHGPMEDAYLYDPELYLVSAEVNKEAIQKKMRIFSTPTALKKA